MRYSGGKSKLARAIAQVVAAEASELPMWEPFCGGGAVTAELAKSHPELLASDIHPALISMYLALQSGWQPPSTISKEQWQAAKALPDTDPLKAFIGFGCSYGGQYFMGYAEGGGQNYADESRRNLAKIMSACTRTKFECMSFFERPVCGARLAIYCDPPYSNTDGKYRTGRFDTGAFWQRAQEWAQAGARVFVSELSCPLESHRVLWKNTRKIRVGRPDIAVKTELLIEVLPEGSNVCEVEQSPFWWEEQQSG